MGDGKAGWVRGWNGWGISEWVIVGEISPRRVGYEMSLVSTWLKRILTALRAGVKAVRESWNEGSEPVTKEVNLISVSPVESPIEDLPENDDRHIQCYCRGLDSPEIIDPCIRDLVDCLNRHGVKTEASCCGHARVKGWVSIDVDAVDICEGGSMCYLRLSKKPNLVPYDIKKRKWINWREYPGHSCDWYQRKPYRRE